MSLRQGYLHPVFGHLLCRSVLYFVVPDGTFCREVLLHDAYTIILHMHINKIN